MSSDPPPEPADICSKLDNWSPPIKQHLSKNTNSNNMNKDSNLLKKLTLLKTQNPKKIDALMAKTPRITNIVDDETPTQRAIQIVTAAVIVNKRITPPVTLQIIPNKGSSNVCVTLIHCNIFSVMKLKDPTLKIINPQNKIIDTLL